MPEQYDMVTIPSNGSNDNREFKIPIINCQLGTAVELSDEMEIVHNFAKFISEIYETQDSKEVNIVSIKELLSLYERVDQNIKAILLRHIRNCNCCTNLPSCAYLTQFRRIKDIPEWENISKTIVEIDNNSTFFVKS
jgi:hypothetical protein